MRGLNFVCFLGLLVSQSGCQTSGVGESGFTQRSQPLLGTYVTVTVVGCDRIASLAAVSEAFEAIRAVDARMSIHRTDSELSKLNAASPTNYTPISAPLFQVLSEAQRISRLTDGAFDVTLRPVVDLWGFVWKRGYKNPDPLMIEDAMSTVGTRFLELESGAVRFAKAGMSIDLGGIAKGYAVDQAIEALRRSGIQNAMVKAGGDLRVIGAPPGKEKWEVQIEDPTKSGERQVVYLRDKALSTSGDYENFFEQAGRRYSHILDPRTGRPATLRGSCTVIAATCQESDALATALLVLGPDRAHSMESTAFQFNLLTQGKTNRWRVVRSESFSAATD